jgi:hypothetical protein
MRRYPLSQGLAIPVTELGYEIVPQQRGETTNHHLYYVRALYNNVPVRHQFRSLVDHVVTMENTQHQELHERYRSPVVPRRELMIDVLDEYLALNGVINCVYEKRTNQTYQITAEQWARIRTA